ncbi:fungal-specific transcription factor domain-containing protein [Penicillium canariense]|uniref:Fungal-specific transcription factor domain-containing protein n=1 Tax=Penicillium canariense TaxID=189055 RepID=A0A9W9HWD2_9EURO|nr:fungal-specific transcription factor domain-containing protein [Penicillium canariense]KAJ5157395.1 fungal-specific transcription factor domain-containing protein [Penicillium canariense]
MIPAPFAPVNNHNSNLTQPAHRHIDLLGDMHLQRQILEHWINHLSDALMPVPGPYNPLKSIFVPIAYVGAEQPASSSSGYVALFYLICASSAFHLSANTDDSKQSSEFMTLALSHHNEGIRHLQNNLAKDDVSERESVLASLLVCLMYEPVTVEQNFWRNHLRGASQWLRKIDGCSLIQTESMAILYQMFASTAIFLRSQMISSEAALSECISYDTGLFSGTYHLHRIFGLPKRLLETVSDIIEIAARSRRQASDDRRSPTQLISTQELDKRELELYLCAPEYPEDFTSKAENGLIYHHSYIFYFALIIYFKRVLRKLPLHEVQLLIDQAFDHIEALKAYTSRPFTPLTWPVAVIFFELEDAALQKRAMEWLEFIIKRSTLSVWERAQALFPAFWARRQDPGCEDMQWDVFLDDPSVHGIMMF